MCGFAGILTVRPSDRSALEPVVERMTAPLAHRGPDGAGVWVDAEAGVGLGFRRLAIIDLSETGHQPMRSPRGRYWMVYNGEVYNHPALRRLLEADGWRFRGRSDTEVILGAFERWGIEEAVQRFVGMFAMAVWDTERRRLWLVRDRLGIKPLFVYSGGGVIAFGSELKALLALPGFDRTLDTQSLAEYLRRLYVPAPRSIFAGVRKLPPGHLLEIRGADGPLPESRPYWSLVDHARAGLADPFRGTDHDAREELDRLLGEAVAMRLRADVPLGALLSGGIDSTAIVSLMQEHASGPTRTFSIAFDAEEHNEAPHARRIAEHLGTRHTELRVDGRAALELVPRLAEIYDEPHADTAQIPAHLICRLARSDVTVALSGDGGDEVFGGYNRYAWGAALLDRLELVPLPARRAVALGIGSVSPGSWERAHTALQPFMPAVLRQRLVGEKVRKLERLMCEPTADRMYGTLVSVWQEPREVVLGASEPDPRRGVDLGPGASRLHRMMLDDQLESLPDDHLTKVDRASMAASLELRVPLLDHRVVEFSWRLPERLKVRRGVGKVLLREVAYRRVPRELLDRPKTGFTVPLNQWLRGPLREWAEDLLQPARLERQGLLRPEPIQRAWRACLAGRKEPALDLWSVLMLQTWADRWL